MVGEIFQISQSLFYSCPTRKAIEVHVCESVWHFILWVEGVRVRVRFHLVNDDGQAKGKDIVTDSA